MNNNMWEKSTEIKVYENFDDGKYQKIEKWQIICFEECWKIFFIDPFLHRGYYLFSKNSESSIEQLNSFLYSCKNSIIQ